MTKNFIKLIEDKDYKGFKSEIEATLQESKQQTFLEFADTYAKKLEEATDGHNAMVAYHLDNMSVVDTPENLAADHDIYDEDEDVSDYEAVLSPEDLAEIESEISSGIDSGMSDDEIEESIVSKYTKKGKLDATGKAVIDGDNTVSYDEDESSKKGVKSREKKASGMTDDDYADAFDIDALDLEEAIAVFMDEGMLTEEELDTIDMAKVEELSKAYLAKYSK